MKKNIYDLEKQLSYIRRCEKCGIEKPNRAHHCSKCGKCYIRFDHHCPTVGNCIAYLNIQPFALYLSYGALILFSLSFISGISFVFSSPISTSIASSLSVLYFLLGICLSMFAWNTVSSLINDNTTLEKIYRSKMGLKVQDENYEVFWGKSKLKWFIPHQPEINGLIWSKSVINNNYTP